MAITDCCTREIVAWHLELRCRGIEAEQLIERAAAAYAIQARRGIGGYADRYHHGPHSGLTPLIPGTGRVLSNIYRAGANQDEWLVLLGDDTSARDAQFFVVVY